ncbi:MAG: hypothetical protein V1776_00310 [Candidatus Diapherotrites archaeon]
MEEIVGSDSNSTKRLRELELAVFDGQKDLLEAQNRLQKLTWSLESISKSSAKTATVRHNMQNQIGIIAINLHDLSIQSQKLRLERITLPMLASDLTAIRKEYSKQEADSRTLRYFLRVFTSPLCEELVDSFSATGRNAGKNIIEQFNDYFSHAPMQTEYESLRYRVKEAQKDLEKGCSILRQHTYRLGVISGPMKEVAADVRHEFQNSAFVVRLILMRLENEVANRLSAAK